MSDCKKCSCRIVVVGGRSPAGSTSIIPYNGPMIYGGGIFLSDSLGFGSSSSFIATTTSTIPRLISFRAPRNGLLRNLEFSIDTISPLTSGTITAVIQTEYPLPTDPPQQSNSVAPTSTPLAVLINGDGNSFYRNANQTDSVQVLEGTYIILRILGENLTFTGTPTIFYVSGGVEFV